MSPTCAGDTRSRGERRRCSQAGRDGIDLPPTVVLDYAGGAQATLTSAIEVLPDAVVDQWLTGPARGARTVLYALRAQPGHTPVLWAETMRDIDIDITAQAHHETGARLTGE